ncbi:DUF4113 domain-containing protein, partial [Salmonella enterica]
AYEITTRLVVSEMCIIERLGIAPDWQMKREMLSPAYTTRWNDLPVAMIR